MADKKELVSDDFDVTEDADVMPPYYDGEAMLLPEDDLPRERSVAVWQRIEVRMEELKLKAALSDWNDWDEDHPLRQ